MTDPEDRLGRQAGCIHPIRIAAEEDRKVCMEHMVSAESTEVPGDRQVSGRGWVHRIEEKVRRSAQGPFARAWEREQASEACTGEKVRRIEV